MAPCIDDARARQNQVDQPDMHAVVRHLVDEKRRALLALDPGLPQVLLAELAALRGAELCQRLRVLGLLIDVPAPGEVPRHCDDVRELRGALDLRMAREHLLDQRGASTRHAHDEDRILGIGAETGAGSEEFLRQECPAALDVCTVLTRIVDRRLAPQPVTRIVCAKASAYCVASSSALPSANSNCTRAASVRSPRRSC